MAIPKYDELFTPVLLCLKDGNEHKFKEIVAYCSDYSNLTDDEKATTTSSGQVLIANRVGWARAYLKKAGLIENTSRGVLRITNAGKEAIETPNTVIDIAYLMKFDSFKEFLCPDSTRQKDKQTGAEIQQSSELSSISPQEQIDNAMSAIRNALADELMDEVMKIDPYEFERLIIKLLVAMGYGSMLNNRNSVTKKSGDEGIDGVLTADKFGFDSIYIQAKQWKKDSVVGRPEIQKFGGAMMGQGASKGLFITTAKFSNEAREFARKNLQCKIVLVDGDALSKLMIEYDVGVSTVELYKIKKVDTDFFTDLSI